MRSFLVLVLCTICVCPLSGSATAASSDRTFLIGEMYRYAHSSIMCANMGFAIDCVIDGLLLQESAKGMENITVRGEDPVVDLPTAPGSPVVSLRAKDIEMLPTHSGGLGKPPVVDQATRLLFPTPEQTPATLPQMHVTYKGTVGAGVALQPTQFPGFTVRFAESQGVPYVVMGKYNYGTGTLVPNNPYALLTEAQAGLVPAGGGTPIKDDFTSLRLNWNRLRWDAVDYKLLAHIPRTLFPDGDSFWRDLRKSRPPVVEQTLVADYLKIQRINVGIRFSLGRDDFGPACSALPALALDFAHINSAGRSMPTGLRLKFTTKISELKRLYMRFDSRTCGGTGMTAPPPKKQLYKFSFPAGLHLQYTPVPGYHESTRTVDVGPGTACGSDPMTATWSIVETDAAGTATETVSFSQTNPHLQYREAWPTGDRFDALLRLAPGASPHVTLEAKYTAGVTNVLINPSTEPVKAVAVQTCS